MSAVTINNHDVSNQEILETINTYAQRMEKRLQNIESNIGTLKSDVGTLKSDVGTLKSDVGYLTSNMVTKDYLDEKLADLRGDFVVLTRKEDQKLKQLVEILRSKNVLDDSEVKKLFTMEPFPQLMM